MKAIHCVSVLESEEKSSPNMASGDDPPSLDPPVGEESSGLVVWDGISDSPNHVKGEISPDAGRDEGLGRVSR